MSPEEGASRPSGSLASQGRSVRRTARACGRWLVGNFRRHLLVFAALNALLSISNALTGPPWWAFWPFLVTGLLLALHYLAYKVGVIDDEWAEERIEELNLKSYDRSHIEDLKARYPIGENAKRGQR